MVIVLSNPEPLILLLVGNLVNKEKASVEVEPLLMLNLYLHLAMFFSLKLLE